MKIIRLHSLISKVDDQALNQELAGIGPYTHGKRQSLDYLLPEIWYRDKRPGKTIVSIKCKWRVYTVTTRDGHQYDFPKDKFIAERGGDD